MAVAGQDNRENSEDNKSVARGSDSPALYITDATAAALGPGITDNILDWSGLQGALLVVSGDELRNFAHEKILERLQADAETLGVDFEIDNRGNVKIRDPDLRMQAMRDVFGWSTNSVYVSQQNGEGIVIADIRPDQVFSRILNAPGAYQSQNAAWMREFMERYPPEAQENFMARMDTIPDRAIEDDLVADVPGAREESLMMYREERLAQVFLTTFQENSSPYAMFLGNPEAGKAPLHGFIGVPNLSMDLGDFYISGIEEQYLRPLPPSHQNYQLFFSLMHEAGHLKDPDLTSDPAESDALQSALSGIYRETFAEASAIRTFLEDMPGDESEKSQFIADIQAKRAVTALRNLNTYEVILNDREMSEAVHHHNVSPNIEVGEDRQVITGMFNSHSVASGALTVNSVAALIAGNALKEGFLADEENRIYIEDTVRPIFAEKGLSGDMPVELIIGQEMMWDDSRVHYAAVKTALAKGYFPPHSAEEVMAREFVEGYERIVRPEVLMAPELQDYLSQFDAQVKQAPVDFSVSLALHDPAQILMGDKDAALTLLSKADATLGPAG